MVFIYSTWYFKEYTASMIAHVTKIGNAMRFLLMNVSRFINLFLFFYCFIDSFRLWCEGLEDKGE